MLLIAAREKKSLSLLLASSLLVVGCSSTEETGTTVDAGEDAGDVGTQRDAGAGDQDGDGISDEREGRFESPPTDTDNDGTPDYQDSDSDGDGLSDRDEGTGDVDGDGIPNNLDPRNDLETITPITLKTISTTFNKPIGIDYHEPTNSVVMSVNHSGGMPLNFERVESDGSHEAFSTVSGLTNEVKIATARSGNPGGFVAGDLFVGNGLDGQIARLSNGGDTVEMAWVDLPGDRNGLMRGSLYLDRTGVWDGDLIAVTTRGEVWRIDSAGVPTAVQSVAAHLEGVVTVPDAPARYGPLAGKILAGAEKTGALYAFSQDGMFETYFVGVDVEDIDIVPFRENFFGVNFGTRHLLGAAGGDFTSLVGDIILTQEKFDEGTGLFRLAWDGVNLESQEIPVSEESATVGQWEHVTFTPAGIVEVPPLI